MMNEASVQGGAPAAEDLDGNHPEPSWWLKSASGYSLAYFRSLWHYYCTMYQFYFTEVLIKYYFCCLMNKIECNGQA